MQHFFPLDNKMYSPLITQHDIIIYSVSLAIYILYIYLYNTYILSPLFTNFIILFMNVTYLLLLQALIRTTHVQIVLYTCTKWKAITI